MFPLIVVVGQTTKTLIVFSLLVAFLWIAGEPIGFNALVWLPIILLIQLVMLSACSLLVAGIHPFIPDIKVLVDSGLTLLFFVSGVFFRAPQRTDSLGAFFDYNPVAVIIGAYRAVLLDGVAPSSWALLWIGLGSLALLGLAGIVLHRYDRLYVKLSLSA